VVYPSFLIAFFVDFNDLKDINASFIIALTSHPNNKVELTS
jgi:hypothetical protein